jgi:hypothetical protein
MSWRDEGRVIRFPWAQHSEILSSRQVFISGQKNQKGCNPEIFSQLGAPLWVPAGLQSQFLVDSSSALS